MNTIEMIAEILRGTNDGDDLHLIDREVLDFMSDGGLCEVTEMDELAFYELCDRVRMCYRAPRLHDIENLAITREGFVYWRNSRVDHYELPTAFEVHAKPRALALASQCRELERLGRDVTEANLWELRDEQCTELAEAL
jgi:hypothetical protein